MAISLTCPQCASPLETLSLQTKLVMCAHCHSSLLVEKKQVRNVNLDSQIHDRLSLIYKQQAFVWKTGSFTPQGFIQYKHNHGYRTDWWVLDDHQQSFWLYEDAETFFLLKDIAVSLTEFPAWERLQPNTQLEVLDKHWLVTEKQELAYQGIYGNLPETEINQHLRVTYLVAQQAETLVLQYHQEQIQCRQGYWLDPFELESAQ